MTKKFKLIPGSFGKTDESATTKAFEEYVGGIFYAEQLMRIYKNSYPGIKRFTFDKPLTKEEVFRNKASREGFTHLEIDAFLML
jgi:hypothetical protein